jgi:hypothetical protein
VALKRYDTARLKELIKLEKYSDYIRKFYKASYIRLVNGANLSKLFSKDILSKRDTLGNNNNEKFVIKVV